MPRALIITRVDVPSSRRDAFLEGVRRRRAHFTASGCNYWLFMDPERPESYVEFAEARDTETLRIARLGATRRGVEAIIDGEHILSEVELT